METKSKSDYDADKISEPTIIESMSIKNVRILYAHFLYYHLDTTHIAMLQWDFSLMLDMQGKYQK